MRAAVGDAQRSREIDEAMGPQSRQCDTRGLERVDPRPAERPGANGPSEERAVETRVVRDEVASPAKSAR